MANSRDVPRITCGRLVTPPRWRCSDLIHQSASLTVPPVGDATDPPLSTPAIRPPSARPPDAAFTSGGLVGRAARRPAPPPMAPESGAGKGSSPTRLSRSAPSRQETGTGTTVRRANRPGQPAPRQHLIPTVFQVLVAKPGATTHNHFRNVIFRSCFSVIFDKCTIVV